MVALARGLLQDTGGLVQLAVDTLVSSRLVPGELPPTPSASPSQLSVLPRSLPELQQTQWEGQAEWGEEEQAEWGEEEQSEWGEEEQSEWGEEEQSDWEDFEPRQPSGGDVSQAADQADEAWRSRTLQPEGTADNAARGFSTACCRRESSRRRAGRAACPASPGPGQPRDAAQLLRLLPADAADVKEGHPRDQPGAAAASPRPPDKVLECRFLEGGIIANKLKVLLGGRTRDGSSGKHITNRPELLRPQFKRGARTKYEGPRDHPRLVMHCRPLLLPWSANVDTQIIVDGNLLALEEYLCAYACKGSQSTQDMLVVFREMAVAAEGDANVTAGTLARKMLMKLVGCVDRAAHEVDFINAGGTLVRSSRRVARLGLSGARLLAGAAAPDGSVVQDNVLDKFHKDPNRPAQQSLREWRSQCPGGGTYSSGKPHAPYPTGCVHQACFPPSEDYARTQLMLHSPGTCSKPEELLAGASTYVEALETKMRPATLSEYRALDGPALEV
jgi:hypothetical protein